MSPSEQQVMNALRFKVEATAGELWRYLVRIHGSEAPARGTVSSALTALWAKKLVERDEVPGTAGFKWRVK
jgi:predicted transcriptional regulator